MSASPVDVVVSGGGIGGAVLAELLARRGKRVVVLERNTSPPTFLRPELLWPASIDVLCGLHPRETWETEVALPVRGIRIDYGRDPFAAIGEERLRAAGVAPWFVNPNDARELLLRRARFEVRRGVEVVSILRAGDRVSGVRARDRATGKEDDVPARLTIGDDGEHSIVRAGCGIPLETRRFPVDFLCFGIEWPASFERGVARVWIVPGGRRSGLVAFAAMPFVRGKGAGLLVVRGDAIDSGADLETPWRDLRAQIAEIGEVAGDRSPSRGMTRVRRHFGHAPRYGCDGAFLLGDAAHPVSPAGGQGANMSIADARVLGRLL
ncbi:MAG TPA: NAD(P)/FAD-dependent oxidoreductase, partial [Planctomycetota bacterium]|nr:NAD(P)/FAD-dependent oxidoreductase [Planctomycetota bacterium]